MNLSHPCSLGMDFEHKLKVKKIAGDSLPAIHLHGEFDPGSGRTLAARLTHASRARTLLREGDSGERVSNTWIICPGVGNNAGKPALIPHIPERGKQQCARGGVRGRLASW